MGGNVKALHPPGSTQWGRVMLLFGAGVVSAFQVGKVPPVLPLLRAELGLSLFIAGWVLSAINILGATISPTAGAISDWVGHRRMILFGLACEAVGSLTGAFSRTVSLLLASRFLEGLGYILIAVSVPALMLRLAAPGNVRVVFGVWASFMPTGAASMMIVAPFLARNFGWRGLWLINAGLLLAFALWLTWATRDISNRQNRGPIFLRRLLEDVWLTVKTPGPLLLALCFGTYTFQFLVVVGFLPTLLIEEQSMTQTAAGFLTAMVVTINVAGTLLGGWLLKQGAKRWALLALTSTLTGLCCFGIYNSDLSPFVRYGLCLTFSCVGGILPSAALHGATVLAPTRELVGTSNGLLMQGAQLGLLTGPPLVAAVVARAGTWGIASWILVIPAALGVCLSFALKTVEEPRTGEQLEMDG
jgi:MFS family permease